MFIWNYLWNSIKTNWKEEEDIFRPSWSKLFLPFVHFDADHAFSPNAERCRSFFDGEVALWDDRSQEEE